MNRGPITLLAVAFALSSAGCGRHGLAVMRCIVVADDGSSVSGEDEIFADEAAAAAAASLMRFGVAPQWNQRG